MTAPPQTTSLALLLGRLERLNESLVAEICGQHGVSPAELRVLAMLRHGRGGTEGLRPTEIGTYVVQTSGGLTATLRRLEGQGRIERRSDPADGRGRLVVLTEAGRAFYDELLADLGQCYETVLEPVDVGRAEVAVRDLIDALERSGGRAPTGGWSLTPTRS